TSLDYDRYWKFFEEDLTEILQDNLKDQSEDDAQTLARKCAQNEPDADDKVNQILAAIDLDIDAVLKIAKDRKAKELAQDYVRRNGGVIKLMDGLVDSAGWSINALRVRTVRDKLENTGRIDRLTTIAEPRRNAMLREIDRRRAVLSEALRRQV